jgi:hypothetical protein
VVLVEEQEATMGFYGGCRSGVVVVTDLIMVRWMRGKRKKERAVVFLRNYPFFKYGNDNINQSCSIVVKTCCMNIISVVIWRLYSSIK